VAALEGFAHNHTGTNHHVLKSLESCAYGQEESLIMVTQFMRAYRHFTKTFVANLQSITQKLGGDEESKSILHENMEEEAGHYDEATKEEMRKLGLTVEPLLGVPHKEVYVRCMTNVARVSGATLLREETYKEVVTPVVQAFESCCISGSISSGLAAMYFGSELIVPQMYKKIYAGIKHSNRFTLDEVAYFPLHIDMDVDHADHMRGILLKYASTHKQRCEMLEATCRVMAARSQFYELLLKQVFSKQESVKEPGFQQALLDPTYASTEEFVAALEEFAKNHLGTNHHVLKSLESCGYGEEQSLVVVTQLMRAYRHFTKTFVANLQSITQKLGGDEESKSILHENMEEEAGHYDEATKEEMRKLGLTVEPLLGVPHKEVYVRCLTNIADASGATELSEDIYKAVVAPIVQAFERCCIKGTASSGLAAMYFGSELIVPQMYKKIYAGIKQSNRFALDDVAFFPLHIDMDVDHADHMRGIILKYANSLFQRCEMLEATSQVMAARCQFYELLLERVFCQKEIVPGFRNALMDPTTAPSEEFVAALEEFTLQHLASKHPVLSSLTVCAYGQEQSLIMLTHFVRAFRLFAKNSEENLQAVVQKLGNDEESKSVLCQKNEVEAGQYDAAAKERIKRLSLSVEPLLGVPHQELYSRCVASLAHASGADELSEAAYREMVTPVIQAVERCCIAGTLPSGLASMYFYTQLLVPVMYKKMYASIIHSGRLTPDEVAFLPLRIELGADHANRTRGVVLKYAGSRFQRFEMLEAVCRVMDARCKFYDKVEERFLGDAAGHGHDV